MEANKRDLEKIATDSAETIVGAISAANQMGLINEQSDLQALIKEGVLQALDKLETLRGNKN